jgi:hypothetical protein
MFPKVIPSTCGKNLVYILHFWEASGVLYNENIEFLNGVTSSLIATLLFSLADNSLNFCEYLYSYRVTQNIATVGTSVNIRHFCNNYSLY